MRPPRNLLVALVAITVGSTATLGWLGWEMLRQDRDAEAQREQARLGHAADRAAQSLERLLSDVEERLSERAVAPASTNAPISPDGLAVLFTSSGVQPVAPGRLLFHPLLPERQEPPDSLFAEGEVLEFEQGDPARAAEVYRRLARTADPPTRAAALMRLGRALRNAGQNEAALTAYTEMASLGDVPVIGLPADLIARDGQVRELAQLGRHDAAARQAQALHRDLADGGHWKLTKGQYEQYADEAARMGGITTSDTDSVAMTEATMDLWNGWRAGLPASGRRLVRSHDTALVEIWRGAPERLAAWIVRPEMLLKRVPKDPSIEIALSDAADGSVVAGEATSDHARPVALTPAETGLPWTTTVGANHAATNDAGVTRGQLVVGALGVMLLFLVFGSYFIGRAVKQEMDLARLQADFVSAVSHEFRTPLAAMRQLSELLAAGRVPHEERRQHYYESLAGESRRLQRLVENLLNFGRFEAGARPYQLEPLDPRALVEQVVSEFQSQLSRPECRIEVRGQGETAPLLADRDALALALHNLLDNAFKYSGQDKPVRIGWAQQGNRIALSVRDEGPGIALDDQARIFQKFVRGAAAASANVRGAGVGLAMVQMVVTGHGGEITVESTPGAGSVFTIWLPACAS